MSETPVYLLSVGRDLTQEQLENLQTHIRYAFEGAGIDEGEVVIMCAGELTPMDKDDLREVLDG